MENIHPIQTITEQHDSDDKAEFSGITLTLYMLAELMLDPTKTPLGPPGYSTQQLADAPKIDMSSLDRNKSRERTFESIIILLNIINKEVETLTDTITLLSVKRGLD
jgi:hypothetical protein